MNVFNEFRSIAGANRNAGTAGARSPVTLS